MKQIFIRTLWSCAAALQGALFSMSALAASAAPQTAAAPSSFAYITTTLLIAAILVALTSLFFLVQRGRQLRELNAAMEEKRVLEENAARMEAERSAEKAIKDALLATSEQKEFMNEISKSLMTELDVAEAELSVLKKLLKHFDGRRAFLCELDESVCTGTSICVDTDGNETPCPFEGRPNTCALWKEAFSDGRHIIATEESPENSAEGRLLRLRGSKTLEAVMLQRGGKLIGVLGVDDPKRGLGRASQLEVLADYIAVMLTRRDLVARIKSDKETISNLMNDTPGGFARLKMIENSMVSPVFINDGLVNILGLAEKDTNPDRTLDVLSYVLPEDRQSVLAAYSELMKSGEARRFRHRLLRADKKQSLVEVNGRYSEDDNGDRFLNLYYTDISSSQLAEEERQRELLDNMPCGAAIFRFENEKIETVYLNRRFLELTGRKYKDKYSEDAMSNVHPDDRAGMKGTIKAAIQSGENCECEARLMTGTGGYRAFHLVGQAVRQDENMAMGYITYFPTTTEELSVRKLLPLTFRAIMQTSPDLAFIKDKNHVYLAGTQALAKLAKLSSENEIPGKTDFDLFDKKYAAEAREDDINIQKSGIPVVGRIDRVLFPDGSFHYVSTSKYPLHDADGNIAGIYGVKNELTPSADDPHKMRGQFTASEMLSQICRQYYGVYLLGVQTDSITPLKVSSPLAKMLESGDVPWRESLSAIVDAVADEEYRDALSSFLSPENVSEAFSQSTEGRGMIYSKDKEFWRNVVLQPVRIQDGKTRDALLTITDISQSKHQMDAALTETARLRDIAEHDGMTDLFNRTKLESMMETEYRLTSSCGIIFFDMNDLKRINDVQGHETGDKAINQLAMSLRSLSTRRIHAYRYGGDEFLLVVCDGDRDELNTLLEMWSAHFKLLSERSGISADIAAGSVWSTAPFDFRELLRQADSVMYENKRRMKRKYE